MKKLYFVAVFALVTTGIFFILKFGMKPSPIGIMKPSFFSAPEEIGAVVFRRFYVPIEENKVVVVGIPPQPVWHQGIVRGFMLAAAAEKRPFDVLITEPQMPPLNLEGLPPMEVKEVGMNSSETQAEFIDAVHAAKAAGKRTLVYTASVFSTHLLKNNPLHRYEKVTGEKLFTISSAPLSLRPDQEFLIDPPCVGIERDMTGTADYGCAIIQAGRMLYRKNLDQSRFVSIMQQNGAEHDYLLMTSAPGQDKEGTPENNQAFRMKAPGAFGARGLPTRFDADTLPPTETKASKTQ